MFAQILWIAGSLIFLSLGALHMWLTFFTDRLSPKNPEVGEGMKNTHPKLTRQTTLWNAWTGFNASHSVGAIFLGIANIILAAQYFPILENAYLLILLTLCTAAFYLYLAKKYWFRIPLNGIAIANLLYWVAAFWMIFA